MSKQKAVTQVGPGRALRRRGAPSPRRSTGSARAQLAPQ